MCTGRTLEAELCGQVAIAQNGVGGAACAISQWSLMCAADYARLNLSATNPGYMLARQRISQLSEHCS